MALMVIPSATGRSVSLWISCALAILCNLTTAALEILLVVVLTSKRDRITIITCVALGFEIVSLCAFLWLSGSELFRRPRVDLQSASRSHVKHGHLIFSVVLSAAAGAVTIGASVWMAVSAEHLAQEIEQTPWGFITTLLATTVLSTAFQLVFLVLLSSHTTAPEIEESRSMPEITQTNRPDTSKSTIASNPFTNRNETSSPPVSPSSTSLRSSITLPSRAGSSKTKLTVSRPSSKSADVAQIDFAWDTSSVPSSLRDAVYSHTKIVTTSLPPIPGSRPVSPAKALDGPFLPPSPHPPQSQPASPMEASFPTSTSPPTSHPIDAVPLSPPQAPFMMSTTPNRSRTGSLASRTDSPDLLQIQSQLRRAGSATSLAESVSHLKTQRSFDEDNIHPLFRATSPTPPPSASRNTIVTAATVSDAEEAASIRPRRRTESRVGSPLAQSPVMDSPSLDSPEFFTPSSIRAEPAWPFPVSTVNIDESSTKLKEEERSIEVPTPTHDSQPMKDGDSNREESTTGDEKESVDSEAIPGFILAAGSRGSMQNFEARQRKSEYSTSDELDD